MLAVAALGLLALAQSKHEKVSLERQLFKSLFPFGAINIE